MATQEYVRIQQLLSANAEIAVRHATTTERVIENVSSSSVILTDLLHPDANGLDLLQRLRQTPSSRVTPVIVLMSKAPAE